MANFSATCSRFSQFLKEQHSLAATARSATTMSLLPDQQTMDLFPLHAGLSADAPVVEKDKLTILYGGEMLVFEDFPVEKAKDLMMMAGKADTSASTGLGMGVLPISRRASLHRFIEKRRERIQSSKAPYQVAESRVTAEADSTKKPVSLHLTLRALDSDMYPICH